MGEPFLCMGDFAFNLNKFSSYYCNYYYQVKCVTLFSVLLGSLLNG